MDRNCKLELFLFIYLFIWFCVYIKISEKIYKTTKDMVLGLRFS